MAQASAFSDWTAYFLDNAVLPGGTAGGDGPRAIASSASTSRASRSMTLSADETAQYVSRLFVEWVYVLIEVRPVE